MIKNIKKYEIQLLKTNKLPFYLVNNRLFKKRKGEK